MGLSRVSLVLPLVLSTVLGSCAASPKGIPEGPAPEYEHRPLPPWEGDRDGGEGERPEATAASIRGDAGVPVR